MGFVLWKNDFICLQKLAKYFAKTYVEEQHKHAISRILFVTYI